MYTTKIDIDRHVRISNSKLSENEKHMRGFVIAKLYFRIGEYATARHYLYGYLSVKGDCAAGHKLLGQCYEKLKMPDKAISSYQRSLQLDSKQSDVITSMSNLLISVDSKVNLNKIKYVVDLAESEHLQNDTILNLKLKMHNKDKPDSNHTHDILLKEIMLRPKLPSLRIRLIKNLLEQNRVEEAFKQAFEMEIKLIENFQLSIDWYNTIADVLKAYKSMSEKNCPKSWNYWLLSIITIEKQIFLNMSDSSAMTNNSLFEINKLLCEFDQILNTASAVVFSLCPERELAVQLISHYRGQWCLHAASILFAKEKILDKNQWKNTIRNTVPLLLIAFHSGIADTQENWLKNSGESSRQLIQLWNRQGAFRCSQAGRTILSCITDTKDDLTLETVLTIYSDKVIFKSESDLIDNARKICSDTSWRKAIYLNLFSGENVDKLSTSYFIETSAFIEPIYEIPAQSNLENYEEIAQWLYPSSLKYFVYLGLGIKNLNHLVCHPFSTLNFSTVNLTNCNANSLNQLDMETYLYAAILHARRILEIEKKNYEQYCVSTYPLIMPYANVASKLCTEEHIEWWDGAYKISRNLQIDDISKMRITIQHGIEAVRAVGTQKISPYILYELGEIFLNRANSCDKPSQKEFLELRAEKLYKQGLEIMKLKSRGNIGSRYNYFRYVDENDMATKINYKAERAVAFLAKKYFINADYEGCIDELSDIKLPYAAYFQAEAYKHLDKSNKTPRKSKKLYIDKARECLNNTIVYLNDPNIDANHPLRSIIEQERNRLNATSDYGTSDDVVANGSHDMKNVINNEVSEKYNRAKTDLKIEELLNKTNEVCIYVKEINQSLSVLKDDFAEMKNIDMFNMKSEIDEINTKLLELLNRKNSILRDEDTQELGNLWEDELTNQVLAANTTGSQFNLPRLPLNFPQPNPAIPSYNPYNNSLYNTMYPMYMYPPALSNLAQVPPQQHAPNKTWMFPQGAPELSPLITDPRVPLSGQVILQNQSQIPNQMQQSSFAPQPELTKLSQSTVNDMLITSSLLKSIPPYNTTSLDKSPPINVVITNSDPLPTHNTVSQQPLLSVTIPSYHIKNNMLNNPQNSTGLQQSSSAMSTTEVVSIPKKIIAENPNETLLYSACAKIFKFINNEWKETDADYLSIKKDKITGQSCVVATKNQRKDVLFKTDITLETNAVLSKHDTKTCDWNGRENLIIDVKNFIKYRASFITQEDAKEFCTEFNKVKSAIPKSEKLEIKPSIPVISTQQMPVTTSMNTSNNFGGFTFSSLPKFANPVSNETELTKAANEPVKTTNLFSSLSFGVPKTDAVKQFADFDKIKPTIFGSQFQTTPNKNDSSFGNINESPKTSDTLNQTHSSSHAQEDEDDYVSTAQFEPVIPLPELVNIQTGEENEKVVFEGRAKILRFDSEIKEWKERGVGQMKILIDKNNPQRIRLLMRRDKVHKICCNQLLTKDTKINVVTSDSKIKYARWCGKDFSENQLRDEIFTIRFKSEDQLDKFVDVITKAQAKMSTETVNDDKKALNEKDKSPLGFGDKFKPQTGSWACEGCYINNNGSDLYCVACDTPKDSTVPKKEAKSILSTTTSTKFNFGVKPDSFVFGTLPTSTDNSIVNLAQTTKSATGTTTTSQISGFNIANNTTQVHPLVTSSTTTDTVLPKFGFSSGLNLTTGSGVQSTTNTFSFGLSTSSTPSSSFSFAPMVSVPPTQTNTTVTDSNKERPFNFEQSKSFDFVFQPKSPGKLKSPQKDNEADDDSEVEGTDDEENNAYFTPVIPLPEKIVIKTGEEDEDVLYSHRAKLFRFVDGEWKERGLGDVKILKHKATDKIRVVMRREQIFKICLNHFLTHDIEYKTKDDKSWHFVVNDYSESVLELMNFCLRFKTHEVALGFKTAIDNALKMVPKPNNSEELSVNQSMSDKTIPTTVIGASETVITDEEKKIIEKLKLPVNFFDYKNVVKCKGCRGCKSEEFVFPTYDDNINKTIADESIELPNDLQGLDLNKVLTITKSGNMLNDLNSSDYFKKISTENQPKDNNKNVFDGSLNSKQFSPFSSNTTFSPNNSIKFGGNSQLPPPTKDDNVSEEDNEKAEQRMNLNIPTTVFKLTGNNNSSNFSPASTFSAQSLLAPSNLSTKFSFSEAANNLENITSDVPKPFGQSGGGFVFGNTKTFTFGTSSFASLNPTTTDTSEDSTDKQTHNSLPQIKPIDFFKTPLKSTEMPLKVPEVTGFTKFADLKPAEGLKIVPENIFKTDSNLSFASLASSAVNESNAFKTENAPSSGFYGLTNNDDFSSFSGAKNKTADKDKSNDSGNQTVTEEDAGYDPHYEPIIELPEEIVVKTGEEEEKKLFGERSKIYRFDPATKEWKERGVGELKILHHEEQGTYRLLLRREQIHKLVLNHAITADFIFNPMPNSTGNSYCWATMNYSEEFPDGQVENLAVRFKNVDIAKRFETEIDKCLEQIKSRSDLEPEDD